MSRVDTSTGKGGGQLTENPAKPAPDGGHQPQAEQPAPRSGEGQGGVQEADSVNKQQG
jgi:hypothetical protein